MLIKDQIASFVPSPLRGANIEELGVRFPDMSQIYDLDLQDIVKRAASALEIRIKEALTSNSPDRSLRHRMKSPCAAL